MSAGHSELVLHGWWMAGRLSLTFRCSCCRIALLCRVHAGCAASAAADVPHTGTWSLTSAGSIISSGRVLRRTLVMMFPNSGVVQGEEGHHSLANQHHLA